MTNDLITLASIVLVVVVSLLVVSCIPMSASGVEVSVIRYSYTVDAIKRPMVPFRELSKEQAERLGTYFRTSYDKLGRIILVESILERKVAASEAYKYHDNGVVSEVETHEYLPEAGPSRISRFDSNGKLIPE